MVRNTVLAFVLALGVSCIPASLKAADPTLAQKWVTYGQQLVAQRQYDKAIQAFSNAARADNHNAPAYKGLGNAFYYKRDYANALKYYKFAYQLNPADTGLGGFIPKLEAATAQAAQQQPADLAARYYNARRYDEAIQYYNQAVQANPNDAKAWQGMGNCYYAKQDKPKAVDAYKKAIQLNPQNVALQNFLAKYSPEAAEAAGVKVAYGERDWVQPLWRSAILPGWGQFYNGQNLKGGVLMGANLILLGGTVTTYLIGDSARQTYLGLGSSASQGDFDSAYNTWDQMANLNHIFYIGFGVVYAFTLVDAIVNGKRQVTNAMFEEKPPAFQVTAMPDGRGFGAKYRLLEF
jgi:tetratricopeptide (TPR) repeat protein